MGRKLTTEDFIEQSKKVHGNKYDYSNSIYITANTDINIGCSQHGTFNQRASVHMGGGRCPKCVGRNKDVGEIIKNLTLKHGDKYDYSLVEYVNATTPIKIKCLQHGTFEQTYNTHLKGHGCPSCSNNRQHSIESFILASVGVHGDKYDYSKSEYSNNRGKITIICPTHGEFKQMADHHLRGSGCPKCKTDILINVNTTTQEDYLLRCTTIHNSKYDYSNTVYVGIKDKVMVICPEHGEFEQMADVHLRGCGCQKCGAKYDKSEGQVKDFIRELDIPFLENVRDIISPLELDIYIPSHNIAIEFDGLYWHSELRKPSNYHLKKTEECEKLGIKLIHIFEDEWTLNEDIVKSRLSNILGINKCGVFGRKCEVIELDKATAKVFLNDNHLQGSVGSSIDIALTHNNEVVCSMHFNRPRLGMGKGGDYYELSRFCNKKDMTVVGGASKLLKYFIRVYEPKEIISYADRRWSQGDLYETLGFDKDGVNKPTYHYIIGNVRKHRFGFRKRILGKLGYDVENKTEHQIMLDRGIYRIYDCGTIRYKKSLT